MATELDYWRRAAGISRLERIRSERVKGDYEDEWKYNRGHTKEPINMVWPRTKKGLIAST
jgi:hypothetical protein